MHVAVVYPDSDFAQPLRAALSAELGDAEVFVWNESRGDPADYAVGWLPPREFFARQQGLKAFFSIRAGVERMLLSPDLPPAIPLIRLEDAGMGAQMADYCIGAVLRWLRRRDEYEQQQRLRVWHPLPMDDLSDWPIGVFGLGVLGRQVASAFSSLGFPLNGYARRPHVHPRITCFAEHGGAGDFAAFMRATRVLILLAPLTAQTRNRFDRSALSLLRPSAYLINVARGDLLVDDALIGLLDSGQLAGAALDVFRTEPLPREHPFWAHPRIRVTPHIASATLIAPAARQIADKIRRLSRNEPVSGLVERARGY